MASPAADVRQLFNATLIITGAAFFITQILLFSFAWRYRSAGKPGSYVKGSSRLELAWTIIPFLFFVFLFVWGHLLWTKITTAPDEEALEIEIMAEQFDWKSRYAGNDHLLGEVSFRYISRDNPMGIDREDAHGTDDFIPVQMHIPVGKEVKLTLRSKDVIHSFFIPLFGVKMDAVPGMTTSLHFKANTTTEEIRSQRNDPEYNYEIACAELCGRMHFAMKMILVVDSQEDYDKWYASQRGWLNEDKHDQHANAR